MTSKPRNPQPAADDTRRQDQASHGDVQNRSKKAGHATQLGSGQDQQSQRGRGAGTRSRQ